MQLRHTAASLDRRPPGKQWTVTAVPQRSSAETQASRGFLSQGASTSAHLATSLTGRHHRKVVCSAQAVARSDQVEIGPSAVVEICDEALRVLDEFQAAEPLNLVEISTEGDLEAADKLVEGESRAALCVLGSLLAV